MGMPSGVRLRQEKTDLSDAMIDAVRSVVLGIDMEGHVICWNQAAVALTGISADQIRGHIFHETVLFPGDTDHWRRELDRISAGASSGFFECRWKIHDSSNVLLTCSCSVIRDSAEKAHYIVCTATDSLSREYMTDRIAELRDVSHFLHNTVSQELVALAFHLNLLETTAPDLVWRTEAESACQLVDRCCRDIRVISYMLAPPSLSETTLEASIEMHVGFVREEIGLAIALDLDPVSETCSPEAKVLLFAAVQSWVGRGIRSRPRPAISVRLRSPGGGVVLELEMLPPLLVVSLSGWTVIRERTKALGGEFELGGDSTRISARLSLPGPPDVRTDE